VHRIWQKYGLQPHRVEHFKFSTDPQFERKLADIVGLYLDPPERALVLSVDEKSQIQALNRAAPLLALRPGIAAQMTHDYQRHGTSSLFAALEVASARSMDVAIGAIATKSSSNSSIRWRAVIAGASSI
jgi:hypothetical protein